MTRANLIFLIYPVDLILSGQRTTRRQQKLIKTIREMTAPLDATGKDWPCKLYAKKAAVDALKPVATLVSGQNYQWALQGTAVHEGGSCQVGVSYDLMKTNVIMASYIGGCPLAGKYTFKVPALPSSDKALFTWQWWNKAGNREMYQNCAVVAIKGNADTFVGPQSYRANTGSCTNTEGVEDVFPNPGSQVFYGGDYASAKPSATISFTGQCTYDNNVEVTASAGGGSTGKGSGNGVATGATQTSGGGDSTQTGSNNSSGGGTSTTINTKSSTTANGAKGSSGGSSRTATGGPSAGNSASSSSGSASGSGSASQAEASASASSTTSSASTSTNNNMVLWILLAAVFLIIFGAAFAIFFFRNRNRKSGGGVSSDSDAALKKTKKHRRKSRHGVSSSESSSDSSSDSSSGRSDEKSSRHHHRKHKRHGSYSD
ncbi:hypothetical protein T439DRAFT_381314 [Meredithblackwellia eburnea MCA 4105]